MNDISMFAPRSHGKSWSVYTRKTIEDLMIEEFKRKEKIKELYHQIIDYFGY